MEKLFKCLFIESYEVSNDTVMIRLQKDTYSRHFNLIWRVTFRVNAGWRSQHAARHVRDASPVMHAGIAD